MKLKSRKVERVKMVKFWGLLLGAALSFLGFAGCNSTPEPVSEFTLTPKTEMVSAETPKNFYQVSTGIWRSWQPNRKEFESLSRAGLKSVLNLRRHH